MAAFWDLQMSTSVWVFFKWLHLALTSRQPTGNCHTTGQWFGHWFSYILWYVELKRASIDTIWLCLVLKSEEPATSWLPHHPPPSTPIDMLVVLTRPENKLSKMAGNSASYPFKSWPTDRYWVTTELWELCASSSILFWDTILQMLIIDISKYL